MYSEEKRVPYVTTTREVKEVTKTRSGDIAIEMVKEVAKTAETRTTDDFFFSERALVLGRHHAVNWWKGSHLRARVLCCVDVLVII